MTNTVKMHFALKDSVSAIRMAGGPKQVALLEDWLKVPSNIHRMNDAFAAASVQERGQVHRGILAELEGRS